MIARKNFIFPVAPDHTVAARLEADNTVSFRVDALPQSLRSADANKDGFVDWPEAYAALKQQEEVLPKGFWKQFWYGPGPADAFHVAQNAYYALVHDARSVLAAESRAPAELLGDINSAASKVQHAAELVAAQPGGVDEVSTIYQTYRSTGNYTVTTRPYNNVGLASQGPAAETYMQVKTALDEAASLLAQAGQIALKNQLQRLTEKFEVAANRIRHANGGGNGEEHPSWTERGMSKKQALTFIAEAAQIVKSARKALPSVDSK